MMMKSLEALAQRRTQITDQIASLGDLRCGSITFRMKSWSAWSRNESPIRESCA
jgi:hypothetical protein